MLPREISARKYLGCMTGVEAARVAEVRRETKETTVLVSINLDGTGVCTSNSKIPFLDHMMDVRPLSASGLCSRFAGTWSCCAYHIVYSVLRVIFLAAAIGVARLV